ncbi:MAG TPA: hypothetical protein VGE04_03180 [Chloroflexia bacterium]|jgi:hypothetical protein
MVITLEWWQYILPAFIACAVVGLYMGWRIMGLWTVGVFFSGLVAARLGPKLELFINKFFSVMGEFFAIAADKDKASIPTPQVSIASPWEPVATSVLFMLLVVISWWVARKLAGRGDTGVLGYLIGAIFGVLACLVAVSQAFDYWSDFVKRSGGNPVAGTTITVPQISVGVAGIPSSNPLMGLATLAIGLFLLIIIVYTIWRAIRPT